MTDRPVRLARLMEESGVQFGTSGARGLVSAMSDRVCYTYTAGFIHYLEQTGELSGSGSIAVGGDLRPSSPRIMAAAARAIADRGYQPVNCGFVPSPALAHLGLQKRIPTVMVTGSHIPADRNGIKYTKREGEILKHDEAGMKDQRVVVPDNLFDPNGQLRDPFDLGQVDHLARDLYIRRYLDFFGSDCLSGMRIGVYQHSAVGRDILLTVYRSLGAEVTALGFSDEFIPVDTEAIRIEDVEAARNWSREHGFDTIVSTDGDSDRPLIADESGKWIRGDVAGILAAAQLGAEAVITPVSCNSAVEKCGWFKTVQRTRIGSPFVIESMQAAQAAGHRVVVGYEANGGFLLQTPLQTGERRLAALPTRDTLLPQIAVMLRSSARKKPLSALLAELPQRFTHSDRLKEFPLDKSHAKMAELHTGDFDADQRRIEAAFAGHFGTVIGLDFTDGLRITFQSREVVHLRPSGNAPEFRCYTEADSEERARRMNAICIDIMKSWR